MRIFAKTAVYTGAVLAMSITFASDRLAAQSLLVEISNSESPAPIAGVMLSLTDAGTSSVVDRALTNGVGKHLFVGLAAGRYSLRADVIGFTSVDYGPVDIAAGETVIARLRMDPLAIGLEGITVEGQRQCRIRPEDGDRLEAVWNEVKKGLTVVAWTQSEGLYRYRVLKSTRDIELDTELTRAVDRSISSQFLQSPFESREAVDLAENGFVQRAPDGEADLYFAPDAQVLLSDVFLDTHCFRLRRGDAERAGMVGLAFEPARSQRAPDISGVLWVQPQGWVLEGVDFWYENLPSGIRSTLVGGDVQFQRLPNGAWIVPKWAIRMPSVGVSVDASGARRASLIGTREALGRVLRIEDVDGSLLLAAESGTIEGMVLDSLERDGVAGARVRIEGGTEEVLANGDGEFRLTEVPEGRYTLVVDFPSGSVVSSEPLRQVVDVADGVVAFVRFRSLSRADVLAAACQAEGEMPRRTSVLLGTVRDLGSGLPLANARVRITWGDVQFAASFMFQDTTAGWKYRILESGRGVEVTSDPDGVYRVCAVPELTRLTVFTDVSGLASRSDTLTIPQNVPVFTHDVALSLSTPTMVAGWVEDWTSGDSIETAMIRLTRLDTGAARGTTETVTVASGSDGRFETTPLSVGEWAIEVSRIGYASTLDTLVVSSGIRTEIRARLAAQALEIQGIEVEVLSREREEWRRSGTAVNFVSPGEVDELRDRVGSALDLIRSRMGPRINITVRSGGRGSGALVDFCIQSSRRRPSVVELRQEYAGGCRPALLLMDGAVLFDPTGEAGSAEASELLLTMPPEDIESIRFLQPIDARFRYGEAGKNGALILETRRGRWDATLADVPTSSESTATSHVKDAPRRAGLAVSPTRRQCPARCPHRCSGSGRTWGAAPTIRPPSGDVPVAIRCR